MTEHDTKYKKFIEENPYPRKLKSLEILQGSSFIYLENNNKKILNFSSSDYLGLSKHPLLIQRSQEYAARYGVGTGSSRLVSGNLSIYDELESKLATALGKPAALILGAGYQTNISVIEALLDLKVLGQTPLVFCDRLAHASMLATTRYLSRLQRFQHNDLSHLERLLEKSSHFNQAKFILAESVYSMEGDQADLPGLIALAKHYHAFLYIDDAHAVGVYGDQGWGCVPQYAAEVPLVMGTFSKALGSYGAYVGCSEVMREYLINKCKGLIYSTALSPVVLGAMSAAIDVLPGLADRRDRVLSLATRLRIFMKENQLDFGQSRTHIVPWIIGDAKKTLAAARLLEDYGILATAIQPPTVPVDKCRIRFCLSALHTDQDVDYLIESIRKVVARL
jgi:8-amino-7-oxononanoate synthase